MTSLFSLTLSFYLSISTPAPGLPLLPDSNQLPLTKVAAGIYISDWETATTWETTKNQEIVQYSYSRILSTQQVQQLKGGQLIVFVRGYEFKDTVTAEKPLSLPFYFFMPEVNAVKPLYWSYTAAESQLDITFQAPLAVEEKLTQSKEKVQFRYFLLDKAFLKKHKLNPKDLRNVSYQQILQLTSKTS